MRLKMTALMTGFILVVLAQVVFASYQDEQGPYTVSIITNGGPEGCYYIFHPTDMDGESHPVAVFCVGTFGHPSDHEALLIQVASHGVVVIAGTDSNQANGDQAVAGLNWLINENMNTQSIFYQNLITDNVMAFGHSQGGNAAMHVAIREPVTSILLYMPGEGDLGGADKADAVVSGALELRRRLASDARLPPYPGEGGTGADLQAGASRQAGAGQGAAHEEEGIAGR